MRQAALDIAGRYPVQHYWDAFEPKLLVCQAHLLPAADTKAVKPDAHTKGSLLTKTATEAKVCDIFAYIRHSFSSKQHCFGIGSK